jgi:FixJ family two-component response regulator
MDEQPPTCFVVDDDASVRRSLSYLIQSLGYRVETFDCAAAFLARKRFRSIGCIIADVKMPGMSGMELQEVLGRSDSALPIIFITGHGDLRMGVGAMKEGAVDFLAKPFEDEELVRAIETALRRCRQIRQTARTVAEARKRIENLSPREYEVLRHVITGRLNKQIAFDLGIAEQTIKIHRGRIMKKLAVGSLADLIRLTEKAGIVPAPRRPAQSRRP